MAVNYSSIVKDAQKLLYDNIGTIIASGTNANIDWNEGIEFDYNSFDTFIAPRITFVTTEQAHLTGNDNGVEVGGLLTINIFNRLDAGGNNVSGLDIATKLNTLYGKRVYDNNAHTRFMIGDIITNNQDEILKEFWLTSIRFEFYSIAN